MPRLRLGRPFDSHTAYYPKKKPPRWGGFLGGASKDGVCFTGIPSALQTPGTLPRPKKCPPDTFYPGCAGAGLSIPVLYPAPKGKTTPLGWSCLLEQGTGIEPAFTAWEAVVLPIYEPCIGVIIAKCFGKFNPFLSSVSQGFVESPCASFPLFSSQLWKELI